MLFSLNNKLKKKTFTGTTSGNGNVNINLSREDCVVLGGFCTNLADVMCIPIKYSGNIWGLSCQSTANPKSGIANTSVTIEVYYINFK